MKPNAFHFEPASFVPFRDKEAVARVRAIPREKLDQHANPDYRIRILPDEEVERTWLEILSKVVFLSFRGCNF